MTNDFIELTGNKRGKTSIILVGTHGNEKCGIEALEKILPFIKVEKGRVLIGYGNPKAIQQNVRFTETNLNRMFKSPELLSRNEKASYEYKRAQFLKKYLTQADTLLDIHASLTPRSRSFAICENNAKHIVKYLPFNLVVSGFDKLEPGGTDYYMNSIGKIGICAECGYAGSLSSKQIAELSIKNFLAFHGHVKNNMKVFKQTPVNMFSIYFTKTDNFVLSKTFRDFENVSENQTIGTDGKRKITAPKDSFILFARNRNKKGEEAFLLGENK